MGSKREKFGSRVLKNEDDVFEQNAWDNYQFTDEQIKYAEEEIEKNSKIKMSFDKIKEYENQQDFWNKFYEKHNDKFFKERNWLFIDFPELISNCKSAQEQVKFERDFAEKLNLHSKDDGARTSGVDEESKLSRGSFNGDNPLISNDIAENKKPLSNGSNEEDRVPIPDDTTEHEDKELRILELGCGTGSTIRSILKTNINPKTFVYCSDFSSNAVDILKNHSSYDPNRCHAFVYDCTRTDVKLPCEENSIDILIMIFTLSAIRPESFGSVIQNACKYLKQGGCFLFRDYGRYDMAQLRFKQGKCIQDNFYLRGDGTQSYFFSEDEIEKLFTEAGLKKEWIFCDRRLQINRASKVKMFRVYIQSKFIKSL